MQKKNGGCRAIGEKNTVVREQVKECNSLSNEKNPK